MDRYCTSVHRILRHFEKLITGERNIGHISCYEKMPFLVVSFGFSDYINEFLIYLIEKIIAFFLPVGTTAVSVPQRIPSAIFIERLEYELIGVFGKAFTYLCPYAFVFFHTLTFFSREFFPPSAVPVDIEYNIQIDIYSPTYYLIHSVHISRINVVFIVHEVRPCHRDTKRVKVCFLISFYHILGDDRAAPRRFVICNSLSVYPVAAAFKSIAKVNSKPHVTDYLCCSHITHDRCGFRTASAEFKNCYEHKE